MLAASLLLEIFGNRREKKERRGSIKSEKKEPAQSFGGCAGFDVRNSVGEDTEDSIRPSAVRVGDREKSFG